jgi:CheY-like chemotaxis protein
MHSDGRRILIVDDEPAIAKLLAIAFRGAGYDVRVAADGAEAVNIFQTHRFDVLLSDVRMPGMNGHELVRWVVSHYPKTRTVLMSAFDDLQCEGCGVAVQPCLLLAKPFRPKYAVALVEQIINGSTTPLTSIS